MFDMVASFQSPKLSSSVADRPEVPLDKLRRHLFKCGRAPNRLAVLINDSGANAFDKVVLRHARQRHTVILLEALLDC